MILVAARPKLQKWIPDAQTDDPKSLGVLLSFFHSRYIYFKTILQTLSFKLTIKSTRSSHDTTPSKKETFQSLLILYLKNLPLVLVPRRGVIN